MKIRPVRRGADDASLLQLFRDAAVRRWLFDDRELDADMARGIIDAGVTNGADGLGLWVLEISVSGAVGSVLGGVLGGVVALLPTDPALWPDNPPSAELLYALHPDLWGAGWATRCAALLLDRAFARAGLAAVGASADMPNVEIGRAHV